MKIPPVGAEMFHAGGRTDGQTCTQIDITMLIAAFHHFTTAPKNVKICNGYKYDIQNLNLSVT
jgi:hypothetical protein